jgi:hypothetical protein
MNTGEEKQEHKKAETKNEIENSVKITITKEAAEGLTELVVKVNGGFEAGRVHRQDIASWIISKFMASFTEVDVHQIRQLHYDDSSMLEAMYRRMKDTGEIPEFLRDALRKQFQGAPEASKKNKKSLTKEYINDVHLRNGETA